MVRGPCLGRQFGDPDPIYELIINLENSNYFLYSIFFLFIYSFLVINLIIRNNFHNANYNPERRKTKCYLFCILFMLIGALWFFSCLFNCVIIIYMIRNLVYLRNLNNTSAKFLVVLAYILLYAVYFFPGIMLTTLWMLSAVIYLAIKLCCV